jgi:hypothetical protein
MQANTFSRHASLADGTVMSDSKQITAYVQNESGQLVPLDAAVGSLILEFPSGDSLEIAWDGPQLDGRPITAQIWGGRRMPGTAETEPELDELRRRTCQVALLPGACNLVMVHPHSYKKRQ